MDPGFLVDGVLRSVLGGGRKRSRRSLRYLTGGHRSLWSSPTTLLTAAGVAWGIYETLTGKGAAGADGFAGGQPAPADGAAAPSWGPPPGGIGREAAAGPPALGAESVPAKAAGSPTSEAAGAPPPPNAPSSGVDATSTAAPAGTAVDAAALRLIRLAVSAAHADGVMNDHERTEILHQAQALGVAEVVLREFQQRRPLAEIVTGVIDPIERATLYVLAFTVLRADEQVTGAERIYLAQLANLLGLSPATVQQLEADTSERIDALGDQGPLSE